LALIKVSNIVAKYAGEEKLLLNERNGNV